MSLAVTVFSDLVSNAFPLEIGRGQVGGKRQGNEVGNVRNPNNLFELSKDIH